MLTVVNWERFLCYWTGISVILPRPVDLVDLLVKLEVTREMVLLCRDRLETKRARE